MDPEQAEAAATITSLPHYLMTLKLQLPQKLKGNTKFFYSEMQARRVKNSNDDTTPDQEWLQELDIPETIRGGATIGEEERRAVVKAFRGRKAALLKTHAWLLWQRRLGPKYYACPWCSAPGVSNSGVCGDTAEATREVFRHQAWACPRFRVHWNSLRTSLHVKNVASIADIVFGLNRANVKIFKKTRHRALALHAALWHFRHEAGTSYEAIGRLFKKIAKT